MPKRKVKSTYLVQVDNWLPEVVALLVEVSHTDLSEVTRMVFVHVCSVVMLSTSKTSTTGMLAVLSYTTLTGGNMTAAVKIDVLAYILVICRFPPFQSLDLVLYRRFFEF